MDELKNNADELKELRKTLREYRRKVKMSQEELAHDIGVVSSVLSRRLNGADALQTIDVHVIIKSLAGREAISTISQAKKLLELTHCEDFNPVDWNAPPLNKLIDL